MRFSLPFRIPAGRRPAWVMLVDADDAWSLEPGESCGDEAVKRRTFGWPDDQPKSSSTLAGPGPWGIPPNFLWE